jgi:transposase
MSRTPSGWPNGTQHGLLSGSFIPPRDQREVRELTRYRTSLVQERARAVNRLQNYPGRDQYQAGGCGHRHPGRVGARNVGGAAGRTERCRAAGRTGARATQGQTRRAGRALVGTLQAHHRFLLQEHLDHIDRLDEAIGRVTREIGARLPPHLLAERPLRLRGRRPGAMQGR